MKIGLVLAEPPAYSETFLTSKINGLIEQGFQVYLFVGGSASKNKSLKSISAWPVFSKNLPIQLLLMAFVFGQLFLRAPRNMINFIKLERASGKGIKAAFENLYINAHILAYSLDWLHFAFATLSVGKENTAEAVGAKMAVSFRGFDISIYPLKNPGIYNYLWKKLDKVHTISNDLYKIALKQGLPNTIPFEKITPAINLDRFSATKELMSIKSPVKILTVARLHWKKGLEFGLAALKILKDEGIEFEYSIIGEGPELERLLYDVNEYGLKNQVKFLGKLKPKEVANLMKSHDIYLQPSIQEGFCNAVLEAQYSGLLCIVSDAEGLPENVIHNQTGWVVSKRDIVSLAKKIKEVLNMEEDQLEVVRNNAINRVKADFNIKQQNEQFGEFYTK